MRQLAVLDEWQLQGHLADAAEQKLRLERLLEEQQARLQKHSEEERQRKQAAALAAAAAAAAVVTGGTSVGAAAGAFSSGTGAATTSLQQTAALQRGTLAPVAATPSAGSSKPSAAETAKTPKSAAAAAALAAQKALLAAGPPADGAKQLQEPPLIIDAVVENVSGQLDLCYSHLKHIVSSRWLAREEHMPGLLLMQHHAGSAPQSAAVRPLLPDTGILEAPPDTTTVLRLQSVTAAAAALQLPRGHHVLKAVCSDLLLHTIAFACASEFEVYEEGVKPVGATAAGAPLQQPSSGATAGATATAAAAAQQAAAATALQQQQQAQQQIGALQHDGEHDAIRAGARQLLFRFLLQSTTTDPCTVNVRLGCSSTVLAAATRLLVVDNATKAEQAGQLNRIEGLKVGFAFL